MNTESGQGPIWVTDPVTKQEIDVAPFLTALNTLDNQPNLPVNTGGLAAVRRVLRRLNLTAHDCTVGSAEMVSMYHDLHIIEDMFEKTRTRIDEEKVN